VDNNVLELKWPYSETLYKVLHTASSAVIYPGSRTFLQELREGPPSEANSSSASREILHILWNLKVHHYFHKSQSLVPVLSQTNAIHALKSFCKIHYNIIPPSMPVSSKVVYFLHVSLSKSCMHFFSPHTMHMHCQSNLFENPNNIWWGVQIMKFLIMQFSPVSCYVLPLTPTYLPSTRFSHTLNMTDRVSHPYKTTGKTILNKYQ
jgi:hypothetical protein